jgi:hypothetical protein
MYEFEKVVKKEMWRTEITGLSLIFKVIKTPGFNTERRKESKILRC